MRAEALALAYVAALSMATGAAQAAGPTQAELNNAVNDSANWPYVDHDYRGQRYTPLDQITSKNAADLAQVCSHLPRQGAHANGAHRLRWHPLRDDRSLHRSARWCELRSRLAVRMEAEGPRDVHHPARRRHKGRQAGARHRGRLSPGAGRQDRQRAVVAADCEAQRRLFHQHAAADLRGPRADRPGRV